MRNKILNDLTFEYKDDLYFNVLKTYLILFFYKLLDFDKITEIANYFDFFFKLFNFSFTCPIFYILFCNKRLKNL